MSAMDIQTKLRTNDIALMNTDSCLRQHAPGEQTVGDLVRHVVELLDHWEAAVRRVEQQVRQVRDALAWRHCHHR